MCRLAAAFILLLAPSVAIGSDWHRVILTPKGERTDSPVPHELKYFTEVPELRDEADDYCYLCSPTERRRMLESIRKSSNRMEAGVNRIGMIEGFEVFDVIYRAYRPSMDTVESEWKSIVVKVGADRYREIYHYQKNGGGGDTSVRDSGLDPRERMRGRGEGNDGRGILLV